MEENTSNTDNINKDTVADNSKITNEILDLNSKLENCSKQQLYIKAEFDNYKKRMEKEQKAWSDRAQENVLIDLLPIIDNFDLAIGYIKDSPKECAAAFGGIELIIKEFQKFLNKYHVTEISKLEKFDPEFHEAVMQEANENKQSGDIIKVLQKGYMHKDKVIRPAQVSVVS